MSDFCGEQNGLFRAPTVMTQRWGAITDRGVVREVNEDALLADPPLFIVADGMGGHAAGDVASWLAVDAFVELVERGNVGANDAIDAISAANAAILDASIDHPERAGMGTTISGLAGVHAGGVDHWLVFNVGDSRVYRLADGILTQLTIDHSEAEELVAAGQLTRDQARSYRRRNVVTRSLGTDPAPAPDSWVFPPVDGERFLICSDGLTTEVDDVRIRRCLVDQSDPQAAAASLVKMARDAGGRDNITVIVVDGERASEFRAVDEDTNPRGENGR